MTTEQIRENIPRAFEMFNSGDLSQLNEVFADDVTYRSTSGEEVHGIDEFKELYDSYQDAFDNLSFEIEEMFTEGNRGVLVYRQKGTHVGELMGIEPSNNDLDILYCSIGTFDDNGLLVDNYDIVDTLELMRQLDALPREVEELSSGMTGAASSR